MKKYKRLYYKQSTFNNTLREAPLLPRYAKNIINTVIENKSKLLKGNKVSFYIHILNKILKPYRIFFVTDKSSKPDNSPEYLIGLTSSGTLSNFTHDIIIRYNDNINRIENEFDLFISLFNKVLSHELIHREQGYKLKTKRLKQEVMNHNDLDLIEYLSNKQEIMSRAWDVIEEYRFNGFTDDNIVNLLKTVNPKNLYSYTLSIYFQYIESPKVLKLLFKYIYQYLDRQGK